MKLRRFLAPLLIALLLLVALLFAVAWMPLRQARAAWRLGRNAEAVAIARRWSELRLWPAQYHQILAAAYLTAGNPAAARPYLAAIGDPWIEAIPKDEVARRLFARDRYADFLAYDAASPDPDDRGEVAVDRAAALAALGRIAEAQRVFASIDRRRAGAERTAALERAIAARAAGSVPYVFDRQGAIIAVYLPARNEVAATNDDFAPLIASDAGALTIGANLQRLGANATIETTLDAAVQRAAVHALGNYRGSLVAIDPRTDEVLAIASSPGKGPRADLALGRQYEPGSVVKVLTGLNAINGGPDVTSMFPYICRGELVIDGRHFGDWVPQGHGTLRGIDDALAVSCNVFFADLGLRLGPDRLRRFMTAAGFDGQADLGVVQVPLGRNVGTIVNNFETARYAIGLQHETMNALHVAMLASMMANRGVLTTPRLLRQRRSILGEVSAGAPPQGRTTLASRAASETMIRAMEAVVSERGTGRRAPVPGVSMAMKTGTSGDRASGLEAVIMAFAPVQTPKIAFGIIAEDAGPAEFAGAKIAHDFVEALKGRLSE